MSDVGFGLIVEGSGFRRLGVFVRASGRSRGCALRVSSLRTLWGAWGGLGFWVLGLGFNSGFRA